MVRWRPGPADLARILAEQNPWHANGSVPDELAKTVERPLGRAIWRLLADPDAARRAHVILGPRRVGKTTVLYQTVRHLLSAGFARDRLWWMRLDHPLLLRESLGDLVRTVIAQSGAEQGREAILFLDELVYAADWDLWLKTFHDEHWPVRILATSSATAALRDRHLESGIGRWDEHSMGPYQFSEYLDLVAEPTPFTIGDDLAASIDQLPRAGQSPARLEGHRRIFALVGGFPELLMSAAADDESRILRSQQRLRDEAIERAVYKDIPQSFGIDNPFLLERLLYVLAGQVGGLTTASDLAAEMDGMSQQTVDRYTNYLERTFLVFRTLNYSGTESVAQRRGRKLYFVDGAVRNAALQRGLAPLSDPVEMGLLLENLVASALHGLALQSGQRLFHWRERKTEVDFVLDHATTPLAFEVASSVAHHTKGLAAITARHSRLRGRTYLVAPDAVVRAATEESPGSIPLDALLVLCGRQAEAAMQRRLEV
jgi:predicted AAA+ superfamily ATPase